jgi:hypothetical protein
LRIGSKVRVFVTTGHAEQGMAKQLKERGKDLVWKTSKMPIFQEEIRDY